MPQIIENTSLKEYNTFGIEAEAQYFTDVNNVEELLSVLKDEQFATIPKMILGGGSNVLFTQDFEGLVIKNSITGINKVSEDDDSVILKVGAGENWHEFVLYAIDQGLGGIENLSLIPGTVGAAPMQNIGAYGVEIKDVFESLEALNKETLEIERFDVEDCKFDYRQSVFKNVFKDKYIITSVSFKLTKQHVLNTSYGAIEETLTQEGVSDPTIRDVSNAVIKIRQSKLPDPKEIGNAGSFFKNPVVNSIDHEGLKAEFPEIPGYELPGDEVKIPAAWLIQNCGWKGKRLGDIGVHKNQALVLVNYGGGKGAELKQLAQDIHQSVADKFGIELEMEVNVI
ncbi:MAG: UDP-N-acetylmuramate dehydrogenase [Cyclobacteriaceae bacterium]|jgi:UDP-N-acetylmuramate dehydrogenase|nr:UDP-N-acetylmuramate dehydrogenase [Cyclobacteriaceae bacterium]